MAQVDTTTGGDNGAVRTVLVTGASRGLGRGIALSLAEGGYNVAINYRGNRTAAEQTARDCAAVAPAGRRFVPIQGDISNRNDRKRLVAETAAEFGDIYALVNNAGIAPRERFDITEATEESFEELMRTNLQGPYFLTQEVVRLWLAVGRDGTSGTGTERAVGESHGPTSTRDRAASPDQGGTEQDRAASPDPGGAGTESAAGEGHRPTSTRDRTIPPDQSGTGKDHAASPDLGGTGKDHAASPDHHVVFVTSISAATVSLNRGEYCVSKAGLAMAVQLWAARLAGEGINVYEVRPGIMAT
ncbi:MAG: SDR family NAD(P)-dependent oxidoreductase, partial [Alkalispirochaeta sp.]